MPDREGTAAGGRKRAAAGFRAAKPLKGKVDDAGASNVLTAAQLRNAAKVLAVARAEKAPPKATLALVMACLVEGPDFTNRPSGHSTSVGILQLLDIHGPLKDRKDIERVCRQFLRRGFWGKGGAIGLARDHPSWTAGQIAQQCQGSAYPERYDLQATHARAIIAAWQGGTSGDDDPTSESRPAQWRRGSSSVRESSWTALDRECKRLGRRRFIAAPQLSVPRLVVAADQQLIRAQPHLVLQGRQDAILTAAPRIDLEGIARLQTVDLEVVSSAWSAPPGGVVELTDFGPADGAWLVKSLSATAGSDTARISLQQPTTKVERQADKSSSASGARPSSTSNDPARRIYAECVAIDRAGPPYLYGGAHGPKLADVKSSQGMDCSSSSSLALYRAKQFGSRTVAIASPEMAASFGKAGEGKHATLWARSDHAFITFQGIGRFKRFDTSAQGDGGSGPRMRTSHPVHRRVLAPPPHRLVTPTMSADDELLDSIPDGEIHAARVSTVDRDARTLTARLPRVDGGRGRTPQLEYQPHIVEDGDGVAFEHPMRDDHAVVLEDNAGGLSVASWRSALMPDPILDLRCRSRS